MSLDEKIAVSMKACALRQATRGAGQTERGLRW